MLSLTTLIAILLPAVILAATAYVPYAEDEYDFEHHRDDFNDSQESMEQIDDSLDSLNIDHGHIDYYKHHNEMYEEPTRAQYDFTYEIRDTSTDNKKNSKSKAKTTKKAKASTTRRLRPPSVLYTIKPKVKKPRPTSFFKMITNGFRTITNTVTRPFLEAIEE